MTTYPSYLKKIFSKIKKNSEIKINFLVPQREREKHAHRVELKHLSSFRFRVHSYLHFNYFLKII